MGSIIVTIEDLRAGHVRMAYLTHGSRDDDVTRQITEVSECLHADVRDGGGNLQVGDVVAIARGVVGKYASANDRHRVLVASPVGHGLGNHQLAIGGERVLDDGVGA